MMTESRDDASSALGWTPEWAMPNVTLNEPIEASHAALVNSDDERLRSIARRRPAVETFLSAFRDEFGSQIWPTIAMVREGAPPRVRTPTALGGFRDAVCVSAIVAGHSGGIKLNDGGIIYSDAFDVYPSFPSPLLEGRIGAITPALVGIHHVERLHPQPAPALGRRYLSASAIDQPLLGAILARWNRCFVDGENSIEDRRLFRALEMARAASKMPGGSDATEYDAGRAAALWVSAFEILAHDGNRADFGGVLSLLGRVQWLSPKLKAQDRQLSYSRTIIQTNLAGSIYKRLYNARNDFLHGNPITDETLIVEKCRKRVDWFAASLFRLALTGYLNLRFSETLSDSADDQDRERHDARGKRFRAAQCLSEDAILVADEPPRPSARSE
jgi:hypothetical protein